MSRVTSLNIFSRIKTYLKLSQDLQAALAEKPDDWSKYQKIFNISVDRVYQDIIEFEKSNILVNEKNVYKMKNIFEKRYRHFFLHGQLITWCYNKPFGYAGDFKIIDDIYQNNPQTVGFDRLWDNYFQQLAAPVSIRARKEDLKRIIIDFLKKREDKNIRIMNLAAGPAREIKELLETDTDHLFLNTTFDCYDFDNRALEYAGNLINNKGNVNFILKNAIRIALKKDIRKDIDTDYDLIYSAGLFDYLDERIAIPLLANLRKLLRRDGLLVIANASDKYSNPSATWMEWVAEWYLIYRSEKEFRNIFLDAGFTAQNLIIKQQNSRIMQYCFAVNS